MGVFLAAAGALAFEVLLTRVFSVIMWYHFASMAIATAMFGLSIGGLLGYPLRRRDAGGCAPTTGAALCAASAVLSAAPYGVLLLFAARPLWAGRLLSVFHQPYFEPFRISGGALPPAGDAVQIGVLLLLFSLPFVGAGAVLALAFSRPGGEGKTYLAVMSGSAAGVAVYLAAMRAGSAPAAFLFVSAIFLLAAAAFLYPAGRGWAGRRAAASMGILAILALGAGLAEARFGFGEIRFVRGRYEPSLLWSRWDANSRVAVYPATDEEALRAWGVSPSYDGPAPRQTGMVVDDTGYSALFGVGADGASLAAFRSNIASAAYRVRSGGRALVIGPGGGKDILCALASGALDVTAVEVNPLVVRAADVEFGAFTGKPYSMRGVRAVIAEGRNFLASDRGTYDVIQMTQVFGRIPPSAGAFTMTEDHLYTVEAFREYLLHLSEGGILSVTRFAYERRVWRILSMARAALLSLGAPDPSRHVVVLRDRGLVNILVRRAPWTDSDLAAARAFAASMRFDVPLAPDLAASGLPAKLLAGAAGDDALFPLDFSAPTDDRPFFYYTLVPRAFLSFRLPSAPEFEDRAVGMLRGFLLSAAVLCALFLVAPAAARAEGVTAAAAAFMFLVGLAFILWEIVMIKRLSLLFGAPVLAFAVGLIMILGFSGLGGYRAGAKGARLSRLAILAAVAGASAWLLASGPALARWAGLPLPLRLLIAAAFIFPPSYLMGRFFPAGLKRFAGDGKAVPFYFASNGAATVLGAALTQALALNAGYDATTAVGGALYAACGLLLTSPGGRP